MVKTSIPLAMLAARVKYHDNGMGEIFGFWYWNPPHVPVSKADMQKFFADLMANKSCQVKVRGTGDQIRDLFRATVSNIPEDSGYPFRDQAEFAAELQNGEDEVFVDLGNPKPDFVPIDLMVDVVMEKSELIRKLKSDIDILELSIHPEFKAMPN